MGGCRCTFRECDNSSSNSRGMHFFHYPFRDMVRCKVWADYALKPHFIELPMDKLKNKVVCEEHFMLHMFMNYKKERLIRTAYPQLERRRDYILDLETNTNYIEPEIPHQNDEPQQADQLNDVQSPEYTELTNDIADIEYIDGDVGNGTIISLEEEIVQQPSAKLKRIEPRVNDQGVRVLNSSYVAPLDIKTPQIVNTLSSPGIGETKLIKVNGVTRYLKMVAVKKPKKKILNLPEKRMAVIQKVKQQNDVPIMITNVVTQASETVTESQPQYIFNISPPEEIIPTAPSRSSSPTVVEQEPQNLFEDDPLQVPETIFEPKPSQVDESVYIQKLNENAQQITELKKLLLESISARSTEAPPTNTASPKPEKGPNMNKVQLFNGIKRYLNPSMVALLRMEMFGASEREYKPDEKLFATELLNLGENVYKHLCDEFRFRLPPKKDVERWREENDEEDMEDL